MVEPASTWEVVEDGFDVARANTMETLFCVGNGRVTTRGTLEEGHVGQVSGTFIAGLYDGTDVPVINLVNAPDPFAVRIIVGGVDLDVQSCEVLSHQRRLDLRHGVLHRVTVLRDPDGHSTRIESWRFASMAERSLLGMRLEVTPLDQACDVVVESVLDGHRRNVDRTPAYPQDAQFGPQTRWDKWTRAQHLAHVGTSERDRALVLESRTLDRGHHVVYAADLSGSTTDRRDVVRGHERVAERRESRRAAGETFQVDRLVAIATSRRSDDPQGECLEVLRRNRRGGLDAALGASRTAWAELWDRCDVEIEGAPDLTRAVRFGIHHLLIAADPDDPTVNIGAKSLTGEGYKGHVFWDTEVMMIPFFTYTLPEIARTLLQYRHHTLPGARRLARAGGHPGARFPWESADTGAEECPEQTPDGLHRFWMRDEELHVSADVAHAMLSYVEVTGDDAFLVEQAAETTFETSRFWSSRAEPHADGDGSSLLRVMGPDEFHSHVDDNAFTNELARWHLRSAAALYERLAREKPHELAELAERIALTPEEPGTWAAVADGLAAPVVRDGVIEQFAGYFGLRDVPVTAWDENDMPVYPQGLHHFNCEDTMLLKQPDVLMLVVMLPGLLTPEQARASFDFYEARTLHKSSLSPAIHAMVGLRVGDPSRAVRYFRRSAMVDLDDNQGNTHEGVHIASAAGTWQAAVFGFGGFRLVDGSPVVDPWLPPEWDGLRFRVAYGGLGLQVHVRRTEVSLTLVAPEGTTSVVRVWGAEVRCQAGIPVRVTISEHVGAT